ncbi:MAG TPA: glycogen debranching N-terminal domain-containing protein [Acidimicrobiales bacterium]
MTETAPLSTDSVASGPRQPPLHHLISAVRAPAFSLSDHDGQIRAVGAQGLFVQDVRVVSELMVTVNGEEPTPLGFDIEGGSHNRFEACAFNVGGATPDPVVFLTRRRTVTSNGMTEEIALSSLARENVSLQLRLRLSSDMCSIAAVKSGLATTPQRAVTQGSRLCWGDATTGRVETSVTPEADRVDPLDSSYAWNLTLAPSSAQTFLLSVQHHGGVPPVVVPLSYDPLINDRPGGRASVEASDPRVARLFDRGITDLASLAMTTPSSSGDAFIAAGAPWYLTLFGRDSIWAARMLLPLGTDVALGTLRTLARRQGNKIDPVTNEEPGKIIHELRPETRHPDGVDTDALARTTPTLPPAYYGTVDATPLWVCLLHDAWRWGLAESEVEKLLTPMERCLDWIADFGCGTRSFVSYVDESGHGLTNQGWKDSSDGVQFRDGRIADAPIALCEAQGYAYEAAMHGADLLEAFDRPRAEHWREFADQLARRFREAFWVQDADGPYPAIALDAHGTPVDSLSSNIGHLLATGLLSAEESQLVARRLGESDLNSGFGLRTLAASSKGYNPLSYHCGSVWAHDTAIAITGLRTVPGPVAERAAASLIEGLLAAGAHFEYRLPELYAGDTRSTQSGPRTYPAACHPQAWAAGAAVSIVSAVVGIRPDVPRGTVAFTPLPSHDDLSVSGIRLSGDSVTFQPNDGGSAHISGLPPGPLLIP